MRKPGKPSAAEFLAFTGMLAGMGGFGDVPKFKVKSENKKPTFTPEELEKLASLEGKEKKKYLKELKAKYE